MDINNFPEKECKILIVKMIQGLRKRMEANIEKMQEMFAKRHRGTKEQTEMNITLLLLLSRSVVSDSVRPHRRQPTSSPVPGILQARTLAWVAISFSNA